MLTFRAKSNNYNELEIKYHQWAKNHNIIINVNIITWLKDIKQYSPSWIKQMNKIFAIMHGPPIREMLKDVCHMGPSILLYKKNMYK